jgi:hypothetical protein
VYEIGITGEMRWKGEKEESLFALVNKYIQALNIVGNVLEKGKVFLHIIPQQQHTLFCILVLCRYPVSFTESQHHRKHS